MGSLSDFKVAEGLVVGGSDIHLNHGTNAGVISVDTVVTGNTAGKSLTLKSGPSAGNVVGGIIDFQTTNAGSAGGGSNSGSYASRMSISGAGVVSIGTADINGGNIDGATIATSDITVGSGKTLDVSTGTLTLADNQISGDKVEGGAIASTTISTLAGALEFGSDGSGVDVTFYSDTAGDKMLWDTSEEQLVITGTNGATALNVADGNVTVSDTLTATNIGAFQASGAIDFNTQAMTNVDINSGAIDGAVIGANSAAAGTFGALQGTRMIATTDGRVGGTDIETNTLLQVNGVLIASGGNLGGGGSVASRDTLKYGEVRIHSDIAESDMPHMHVENMGGAFIIDNEEPEETIGQGTIYTVGRGTETNADAWGIGRQSTTGKFAVGYIAKAYDGIADSSENPMRTAQSVFEITTSGNTVLPKSDSTLSFTSNTNVLTSFKGHASASATAYTWPQQAVAGRVLQTAGNGDLSWVAQSAGTITQLNNATENELVTVGNTVTELDAEANLTFSGTTLSIKNLSNDTAGAELKFVKDKGAAGADGDDVGKITFTGDDAAQTQTDFGQILVEVSEADNTDEAGKMSFLVAESDGTTTALTAGLILEGEHATDGQVDVTIGAGAASTTTIAGDLVVNGGTTTISTAQLTVEDDLITVSKGNDTVANAGGSGIEIDVTGATNIGWKYVHGVTGWQSNVDIDLGSTSESYKIAGTDVLTNNQVLGKTLPGTVVGTTEAQELSNKTLQSPKIMSAGETWVTVLDTAESAISNSSTESTIYQYDGAAYRTAKLLIQVTNDTTQREVHAAEMLVTYEGTNGPDGADLAGETANVYAVEYASVYTSTAALGTFDVYANSTSNNTVDVKFNPATQDTYKIKVYATLMEDAD
jgi:hypothetical protein